MPIWITIERHSGVPIYMQIAEQIRHAVEDGTLQPGEQLPTVRQLAGDLAIAPNTIVQAYEKLQGMGLIESRPGAGTVVLAQANGALRHQQIEALYERLQRLVHDAAGLGIGPADLAARFQAEVARFYRESEGRQ
jgi:GntR family transcriptional regulator